MVVPTKNKGRSVFAPVPGAVRVPGARASIEPGRVTGSSRQWVLLVSVTGVGSVAPALLGSLAGDAEPHADVGPGVAEGAERGDGLAGGVLEVIGEGAMVVMASMSPAATRRL